MVASPVARETKPGVCSPKAASDRPVSGFTITESSPPAIAWFGFRSLWGHLRHFAASAIATDDIDARDWMEPDEPSVLVERVAFHLDAFNKGDSISERLGRDLWIDYIADTGDHAGVTEAMGRLIGGAYALPTEGDVRIMAPRGDMLVFGGDTAYPVATMAEIHDRVVVPLNRTLPKEVDRERVLIGIPGNHDWYDGLDGFARLFRNKRLVGPDAEELVPAEVPLRESQFEHAVDFVEQFVKGEQVHKNKALVIRGYAAVQSASYFILPLAPNIDLYGVDRQLKNVDYRQRSYFRRHFEKHQKHKRLVLLPNPYYAFGKPSASGQAMVDALHLEPKEDENLMLLAGDVHHYRREHVGKALHVTAGGGGAFLHPAASTHSDSNPADVEFPNAQQSEAMLWQVPFRVAMGRAGFIPHVVMLLLFAPILGVGGFFGGHSGLWIANVVCGVVGAIVFAFLGGIRKGPKRAIGLMAILSGALMSFVPAISTFALSHLLVFLGQTLSSSVAGIASLLISVLFGGYVFGAYFAVLSWFGLEQTQAFTMLAHPGFKHFVRMRVAEDGSKVECWALGLVDPLDSESDPVLIDHFTWEPSSD